ncbi:MAG TPA: Clp protease N-terminal domain-containing protein [Egibacteraceae bacterium]|nr:Clp protease N-terminal domain-containing protein [Egibacteraceae bacterium]
MFERFTAPARRVVVHAQQEARLLGHAAVGTEHLLLGLLVDDEAEASHALPSQVSPDAVRTHVEAVGGSGEPAPGEEVPLAPEAQEALVGALQEAEGLGHAQVGTGHLLLALLRQGDGRACQALQALGADVDAVRERAVALAGGEAPTSGLRSWGGPDTMSERVVRSKDRARAERDPVRESDPQGWEVLDCAGAAALRALTAARHHAADELRREIAPVDLVVGVLAAGDPVVGDALAEAGANDPSPASISPGYRADDAGRSHGDDAGRSHGDDAVRSHGDDAVRSHLDDALMALSGDARRAWSMAARLAAGEDAPITPAHLLLAALEVLGPVRVATIAERLGAEETALRPALLRRTVSPPGETAPDPSAM